MRNFDKLNTNLRKYRRLRAKRFCSRSLFLSKGSVGLKSQSFFIADIDLIKACVLFLRKKLKKKGKIFVNLNANFSRTKKPLEMRMGKGKGTFRNNAFVIQPGRIFLEVEFRNVSEKKFKKIFYKVFYLLFFYRLKFPFRTLTVASKF